MYDGIFPVEKLILPDPDRQPVVSTFMKKLLLLSLSDSLGKSTIEDTSVFNKHTATCSPKEGTSRTTDRKKKCLMEWFLLEPTPSSSSFSEQILLVDADPAVQLDAVIAPLVAIFLWCQSIGVPSKECGIIPVKDLLVARQQSGVTSTWDGVTTTGSPTGIRVLSVDSSPFIFPEAAVSNDQESWPGTIKSENTGVANLYWCRTLKVRTWYPW
jgi:hypothetical protein